MIRSLRTITLCGMVLTGLAGCGDRHRPAVREQAPEPPAEEAPRPAAPSTPHGLPAAASQPAEPLGAQVKLGSMTLKSPESWVRKRPQIGFILAEFSLPRAEADETDGRLTVSTVGGTAEGNIDRWRSQFGGNPEKQSRQQIEVAGVSITVVDFSGTYRDQRGPFAPAQERPGYRMLGAVLPIGGQLYFVKGYGPQKTVAAHADEFRAFLETLTSSGSP